jgi:ankyrin repeat protein
MNFFNALMEDITSLASGVTEASITSLVDTNDIESLEKLQQQYPGIWNENLLHFGLCRACEKSNIDAVKLFVNRKSPINKCDNKSSRTPLMWSTNLDIVKYLCEQGADVQMTNSNGWSALMWAAMSANYEITEYLIDHGADVNSCDCNGDTALIYAIHANANNIIKLLVDRGAEIYKGGDRGSAYSYAKEYDHKEALEIFDSIENNVFGP